MQREGLEVHISRCLLSLHVCGWNYVCSFFLFSILRIFFFCNDNVCQVERKKPKFIFKFPSCRSYLRRPNNISSLRHVITSNNNFFSSKNNLSYIFFLSRMLFTHFIHGSSQPVMTFVFLQGII